MSVKGVVDRVSEKDGKYGKMFSLKLRDSDTWYGLKGAKYMPVKPGQLVEFEAAQNDRGYWDADGRGVKVLQDAVAEAPAARAVAAGATVTKDDYWRRREDRDLLNDQLRNVGAARNTAIAFVDLLAKYEGVKLPAKQADREKALLEAVHHYTEEFMNGIQQEPAEATVVDPAAKATKAAEEEWT